jgi:hypothetical protein
MLAVKVLVRSEATLASDWKRLGNGPELAANPAVVPGDRLSPVPWPAALRAVTAGTDLYSKGLRQCGVQPLAPGKRECWIAIFPSEITGRTSQGDQWKTKPESTTRTWPVVVSERQKVTTWSATSSADVPL